MVPPGTNIKVTTWYLWRALGTGTNLRLIQKFHPPQKYRYGDEPVPMLGTGSSPYRYFWGGPKACFLVVLVAASRRFSASLSIGLELGWWDTVAATNLVT